MNSVSGDSPHCQQLSARLLGARIPWQSWPVPVVVARPFVHTLALGTGYWTYGTHDEYIVNTGGARNPRMTGAKSTEGMRGRAGGPLRPAAVASRDRHSFHGCFLGLRGDGTYMQAVSVSGELRAVRALSYNRRASRVTIADVCGPNSWESLCCAKVRDPLSQLA